MTKTIKKVTMVVPVLMVSCQKSEKPKNGPLTAHIAMTATAAATAMGLPAQLATREANRANAASNSIRCTPTLLTSSTPSDRDAALVLQCRRLRIGSGNVICGLPGDRRGRDRSQLRFQHHEGGIAQAFPSRGEHRLRPQNDAVFEDLEVIGG